MCIHPILFFIVYTLVPIFLFFIKNKIVKMNELNYKFYNFVFLNYLIIIKYNLVIIFIFLGSIWAQQELNWGGWWNWDFVECIGLVLYFLILYYVHINYKLHAYINSSILISFVLIFINLIFLRSPIFNSIHSFITTSSSVLYKPLLTYFILFYIIIIYYVKKKKLTQKSF